MKFNEYKYERPNLENIKCEVGMQFLPHISMGAGFYVCKLQKL